MINEQIFDALVKRLMNAARDIEHEALAEGHTLKLRIETGVNEQGAGYVMLVEDEPVDLENTIVGPGYFTQGGRLSDLTPEQARNHPALRGPESVYPSDDPLPLLDSDHSADTDEMTVPPDLLTKGMAVLPIEEFLSEHEKPDYKARRSGK